MSSRAFSNLFCSYRLARYFIFVLFMVPIAQVDASEPEVVLIVGGQQFLRHEMDEVINSFVPAAVFHGGVSMEKRKKYNKRAIDVLIDRELLYRSALESGIHADSSEIKEIVEENIEKFGSEDGLAAALRKSGFTLEGFKHRVKQVNAIAKFVQSDVLADQFRYSEEELRAYFDGHPQEFNRPEAVGLWHITLKVKPNAPESGWAEKKKLADDIVRRARDGEDFTKLASEYSEDDYRVKGGWTGYMHKGRLLAELEEQAFTLKKDEVAEPIRSLQGYHVIKAGDRKPAESTPFDEVSASLKHRLEKARFEKLKTDLLNKLRKEIEIKVLVDMT